MRRGKLFYGVVLTVICLLCSFMFVACKPDTSSGNPPAGTLTISQTTAQLDMHEQVQLTVAETGDTTWESGNTAVCTVENGLVKSVGVGVTTVTASQGDKKATCTVTVTNSRSAAQIVLTDGQATISGQKICSESDEFTLNADVKYKNTGVAAADVAELQWSVDDDEILSLTVSDDKKSANIVCSKYGITTVRVATTVWGEPISKALEVCVRNTDVTFSSVEWEKDDEEVYSAEMAAVKADGTAETADLAIVCKDGETDVSGQVKWSASKPGVVTVADNTLTAVAADSVTLTGEYQGNLVTVEVTVTKPTFVLEKQTVSLFGGEGDELRTSYPTADEVTAMRARTVTLDLPDTVAGTVSEFNMTYKQAVGGSTEVVTRNILESVDGKKVSVRPSFYTFNLGAQQATVVTDKAVYTLPLELYTMIIDSKEDLDAFRYYTTYQNEWKETKTAGVFAPILWDGYFVLGDNIEYNASVENYANTTNLSNYNSLNHYESFITNKDVIPFFGTDSNLINGLGGGMASTVGDYGFCGVFDGRGYNIQGLIIQNAGEPSDAWIGGIAQVGGFIGMLTGHTFGSETCSGTIRNVSFTDVVHTRFDNGVDRYGTTGGFLFSVAHGSVQVENINIEVRKMQYVDALIGSRIWYVQLYGNAIFRNVMVHVENYFSNQWNRGSNETHNRTEQSWIFSYIATYDTAVFANSYAVVDTIGDGESLDTFKGRAFAAPVYRDDYAKENDDPTKTFVQDVPADTVPADLFGSLTGENSLAAYLGDAAHPSRKDGWDSAYWEFPDSGEQAGTPVFKTKTNA